MKSSHIQLLGALGIHGMLLLLIGFTTESSWIIQILSLFFILNCTGYLCIATNRPKLGASLFLWSSLVFLPLGLIGTLGARKVLDNLPKTPFMKIVYSAKS